VDEVKPKEAKHFIRFVKGGGYVKFRVSPGAKATTVKGLYKEESVRPSVAAPPAQGKADAEGKDYLAMPLEVPRSGVAVAKGTRSRDKLALIRGFSPKAVREELVSPIH
jgi:uncharacterized protein YggU (UPF0235/DUF167 family)